MNYFLIIAAIIMVASTAAQAKDTIKPGGFIWPLKIAIRITSGFTAMRGNRPHAAIDLAAPENTPVYAMDDGIITAAWNDTGNGGGLSLTMKHANGFTTGFAHLNKNNFLKVGSAVKRGQLIALTGNTGTSTGPHLHLKMRNEKGIAINPLNLLPAI